MPEDNKPEVVEDELEKPEEPTTQDAQEPEPPKDSAGQNHFERFKNWYLARKKWSIPASVLVIILLLAAVPWTRYHLTGLVYKKNFVIKLSDASTGTPVSGVEVASGKAHALSGGNGQAVLRLPVGPHKFTLTKKYYKSQSARLTVPILSERRVPDIQLVATGRQVSILVKNTLTDKILADADLAVAGTTAKTDKSGAATIVLPADQAEQKATLSKSGFNSAAITIKAGDQLPTQNFTLTPAGSVYFMSKRTGKLNLMKANLDGTNPTVVLAGTGAEDVNDSQLSQSPDGKYIALVTKRNAGDAQPQLYMLAAADDKLLTIDTGNSLFLLRGWVGDNLIYTLERQDIPGWQVGHAKLKSYNAATGATTVLDQNAATGDGDVGAFESFAYADVVRGTVVYAKSWSTSAANQDSQGLLSSRQNSLNTINADGSAHKVIANYPAKDVDNYIQHGPVAIYVSDSGSSTTYYDFTVGGTYKQAGITDAQFFSTSGTYLDSASAGAIMWSEQRDGKNVIIVSDGAGNNQSVVNDQGLYAPYGWYSDQYVLLSQTSNQLYIMGAGGGKVTKISDYQATQID